MMSGRGNTTVSVSSSNKFIESKEKHTNTYLPLYLCYTTTHYDLLILKPEDEQLVGDGEPQEIPMTYVPFPSITERYIKNQISIRKAEYMGDVAHTMSLVRPYREEEKSEEQPKKPLELPTSLGIASTVFQPGRYIPTPMRDETFRRIQKCLAAGM